MITLKHLTTDEIENLAEARWPLISEHGNTEHNKNMRRAFIDGCNVTQLHYSKASLDSSFEDLENLKNITNNF